MIFQKDGLLSFNPSPHSPHSIISQLIQPNSTLLDIGCNSGYLGHSLIPKGVVCDGVDINPQALKKAKKNYRRVYLRDLATQKLALGHSTYDYIVLSDILEHLPQPDQLLLDCRRYLSPKGHLLISLPNIARLEIRLMLLLGRFDYQPGILSSDHLRFFTLFSGSQLIRQCGYKIIQVIPTGFGHQIKILPTYTAFQFIYDCQITP